MTNGLRQVQALGQSVWLDDLSRTVLDDGTLLGLIRDDGISGITTNPAIFARALQTDGSYAKAITDAVSTGVVLIERIYERLVTEDVRRAADLLHPTYERTAKQDGYVSLEVSPHAADDAAATLIEARRLWRAVDRPNLMIKVPGTKAGLPAVRALIAEGINVNVTLLFSVARYAEVVDCHRRGLEDRAAAGQAVDGVASVASFFLSRIDTRVDELLDAQPGPAVGALRGQAAVGSAGMAYAGFLSATDNSAAWQKLARRGAMPQRLLWASTSAKDPAYHELKYVEPLIAPQTVTTLPSSTLDAVRHAGGFQADLRATANRSTGIAGALTGHGIDLERVADELEREGVRKFADAFDTLLDRIGELCDRALEGNAGVTSTSAERAGRGGAGGP
ncbi:MAG: transaldolase [Pseudomonadales bacterium]